MEVLYILAFFIAVCIGTFTYKLFQSRTVYGLDVPGPRPWPLIGNMLDVNLRSLHLSVFKMVALYGRIFRIKLLGRNIIIINDVDLVRKAFGDTEYADIFNDRIHSFFGKYVNFDNDIAFSNGNQLTMTKRKMFHRSLKFYGDGIAHFNRMNEEELMQVLEKLKLTNQCNFDMHSLLTKSMANTLARLLNGTSPNLDDWKAITELADSGAFFISGVGFIYDYIPIIRYFPGFFRNRYLKAIVARDKLLDKFYFPVKDTVDNISGGAQGFIQNLMKLQNEINEKAGTEYISEDSMKGIVLDMIGASQETTSTVLTNAFALMLTHPHVAKKIQEEIDKIVGHSRLPNESDKPNMQYTMATVYEILRYTSPVALSVPHRVSKDVNFEGYYVTKDSVILPNHWFIHHDPKLWHEPWEFRPARFLDDAGKLLPPENELRRNIMAFSTGRRECPGENFGKARIFFYLTSLLQSFDIVTSSLDGYLPDTDPRHFQLRGIDVQVEPHLCRAIPRVVAK